MTTEAEIDSRTGLPKLSIELLPDSEEDRKLWLNSCASRSTDYLHRLPVHPADTATKVRRMVPSSVLFHVRIL